TSHGTSNLAVGVKNCDRTRGATEGVVAMSNSSMVVVPSFTDARVRALLAMECATGNRPFTFVNDQFFRYYTEMLRPGTSLPSRTTLSLDIKLIHTVVGERIRVYFMV
ncbi:hypothetical protein K488DRAFT_6151, partial [Vararia minispora EC-137]